MSDAHGKLIKAIVHYQQNLERYSAKNEETKMLHCIDRLQNLPIRVSHLEETGVGRTVNSIRKISGTIGDAARSLVNKWKNMVQEEATDIVENKEEEEEPTERSVKDKGKHSSSHSESASTNQNAKDKNVEKERHSRDKEERRQQQQQEEGDQETEEPKRKHREKEKKSRSRRRSEEEHEHVSEEPQPGGEERTHRSEDRHRRSGERIHKEDRNHRSEDRHKSASKNSKSDSKNHRSETKRHEKDRSERRESKSHRSDERHKSEDEYRKTEEGNKEAVRENKSKEKHRKSDHREKKRKHHSSNDDDDDNYDTEYKSRRKESENSKHKSRRKHVDSSDDEEEEEEEEKQVVHDICTNSNNSSENDSSPTKCNDSTPTKDLEEDNSDYDHPPVKTKTNQVVQRDDPETSKHGHSSGEKRHKKSRHSNGDSGPIRREEKEKAGKSHQEDSKPQQDKSDKRKSSSDKHKEGKSSSSKKKRVYIDDGIDCGSGASFAEALGMLVPTTSKASPKKLPTAPCNFQTKPIKMEPPPLSSSAKLEPPLLSSTVKLEPLDLNISCLLPTISTNYKPLGNSLLDTPNPRNKMVFDDEALTRLMYSKNQRTKVYSGNKSIWGRTPTLFELCTRVLQDNIDALEYTGGVPYSILKPVLEKATPDQLFTLEHHNPYLIEDSDELWQLHCNKEFRTKPREELESWREMYMRCLDEREAKLRALTANIKLSQDKSLPVRQTKLAYVDSVVKPPRNILRKQAKNGFEKKPSVTPSSRLSTLALSGGASQIAVPNPGRAASSSGSSSVPMKPKKAPLMQKTLQLMKGRFRR